MGFFLGFIGKFWHRHRRPRPVVYSSDAEFHLRLRDQEEQGKMPASRKKRMQSNLVEPPSKATTVEPPEPPRPKIEPEIPPPVLAPAPAPPPPAVVLPVTPVKSTTSTTAGHTMEETERPVSPVSTASSSSEPPLAQKVKANGGGSQHVGKSASASASHGGEGSEDVRAGGSPMSVSPALAAATTPVSKDQPRRPSSVSFLNIECFGIRFLLIDVFLFFLLSFFFRCRECRHG